MISKFTWWKFLKLRCLYAFRFVSNQLFLKKKRNISWIMNKSQCVSQAVHKSTFKWQRIALSSQNKRNCLNVLKTKEKALSFFISSKKILTRKPWHYKSIDFFWETMVSTALFWETGKRKKCAFIFIRKYKCINFTLIVVSGGSVDALKTNSHLHPKNSVLTNPL